MSNKKNWLIVALLFFGFAFSANAGFQDWLYGLFQPQNIGALDVRQERNINPATDSLYWLGTTTPASKAWLGVVADYFYGDGSNLTGITYSAFGTDFYTYFSATTTDYLTEGVSNLYSTQTNWDTFWAASTTNSSLITLSSLSITESQISDLVHFDGGDFYTYFNATNTDALSEGTTNFWSDQARWDTFWNASTTLDSVTTLLSLTNASTTALTVSGNLYLGTATTTASNGFSISSGCYDIGGTCLSTGGDADQNLWETIAGDSGSTAADSITDTLTIAGGTNLTSAMSGDTLTTNLDASLTGLTHIATTYASTTAVTATNFYGALTGNASTATLLETARAINGVDFNGSQAITVTAAADTLTGTELKSTVITSSLTSVGTLTDLTVTNAITGSVSGNAGTVSTITTLAPDTATTQATQAGITTCANLTTIGTIGAGVWQGTAIGSTYLDPDIVKWTNASTTYFQIAGGSGTGVWNLGGATSLEIPNGTPTIDTLGEIGVNTTANQTQVYGSAKRAIDEDGKHAICFNIASSTAVLAGKQWNVGTAPFDITFYQESAKVVGGTSAELFFTDGSNDSETITATTTRGTAIMSTSVTFSEEEDIMVETGTITGTVLEFNICGKYRITAD